MLRTDVNGNALEPGGIYRMLTGGNALVVEIFTDGLHFAPIPSFFAGFFRITADPMRLDTLAGHCKFAPYKMDDEA
jgi:hypothetical protein